MTVDNTFLGPRVPSRRALPHRNGGQSKMLELARLKLGVKKEWHGFREIDVSRVTLNEFDIRFLFL